MDRQIRFEYATGGRAKFQIRNKKISAYVLTRPKTLPVQTGNALPTDSYRYHKCFKLQSTLVLVGDTLGGSRDVVIFSFPKGRIGTNIQKGT